MTALRAIDPTPLLPRYAGSKSDVGERPELQWVKIAKLRIDPRYQRDIGQRGANNILAIASAFRWTKFAPVVVAPIAGGLFSIVDGQHRTTAAALYGFESVPCVIIAADDAAQADAFVAINANVTAMSPLQIHAARLAAGNSDATKLTEVCNEAGVSICRYPVPANKMKPGETMAVAMLQAALDKYGRDVLIAALSCITQTRRGNPGMIRKPIIEALCVVLGEAPHLRADRMRLIFAMQTFDFAEEFKSASAKAIRSGGKISAILAGFIATHLGALIGMPSQDEPAPGGPVETTQEGAPEPAPDIKPPPPKTLSNGSFTISRETIVRGNKRLQITPRASLLLQALAKAKPNPVGNEFLIAKIWAVKPQNANELLDQIVRDLAALRSIGLEIRTIRGVGRQLVELPA